MADRPHVAGGDVNTTGHIQAGVLEHTDPLVQERSTFPWEILISPTIRGEYRHRMTYLATPTLILYRERQDTPMRARGLTPANHFTLIVPTRRASDTFYHGAGRHKSGLPCALPREASGFIGQGNEQLVIIALRSSLDSSLTEEQARQLKWADREGLLPVSRRAAECLTSWSERVLRQTCPHPELLAHPLAKQSLEEDLHQFLSSALDNTEPSPAKRPKPALRELAIKRVLEYLRSNDSLELSVPALCRAIGVQQRTLEYSFRASFGISPLGYLRLRRLHAARQHLMTATPNETRVAQIACRYGFFELGKFSAFYSKTFGERPSETLRRYYADSRSVLATEPDQMFAKLV